MGLNIKLWRERWSRLDCLRDWHIQKKINFIGGLKRKDIFNNSLQIRLSHPQKTFQLCNNNFNIIKGFNQDQLLTMHTVVESHGWGQFWKDKGPSWTFHIDWHHLTLLITSFQLRLKLLSLSPSAVHFITIYKLTNSMVSSKIVTWKNSDSYM